MYPNKKILFAVMGWGLGHATRCIPLIQSLKDKQHVIIASNGISLHLLKQEFPNIKCISFPDYAVKYPRNRFLLLPSLDQLGLPIFLMQSK